MIEEKLIETGGKIEKVNESKYGEDGSKRMYHIKLINDPKDYTTFSELPDNANIGDNIYFNYLEVKKDKMTFYNIKNIIAVEKVNNIPTEQEKEIKEEPKINPERAIILKCAVDLCIKRNDFNDESIQASYKRLMEIIDG